MTGISQQVSFSLEIVLERELETEMIPLGLVHSGHCVVVGEFDTNHAPENVLGASNTLKVMMNQVVGL